MKALRHTTYKAASILLLVCLQVGCQHSLEPTPRPSGIENALDHSSPSAHEKAFWSTLSKACGKTFAGKSSFPDDKNDSFYGKNLVAQFKSCSQNEIRVPFAVADDHSRTWIFTRTHEGIQLKHQHLHSDGSPDEVSNYGGTAHLKSDESKQQTAKLNDTHISLSFPADAFTQSLIPAAATNVWTITLFDEPDNSGTGLIYDLTRHQQPRFKATLYRVSP